MVVETRVSDQISYWDKVKCSVKKERKEGKKNSNLNYLNPCANMCSCHAAHFSLPLNVLSDGEDSWRRGVSHSLEATQGGKCNRFFPLCAKPPAGPKGWQAHFCQCIEKGEGSSSTLHFATCASTHTWLINIFKPFLPSLELKRQNKPV